jgi:hypothetical protein
LTDANRLNPGDRVVVRLPGEPFDGVPGTVVRWKAREGWWLVRLDRYPPGQPRFGKAGTAHETVAPFDPGELERLCERGAA